MKICERGVNFIQIIDSYGNIRVCGWNTNNVIGSLLESDFYDIYHGESAQRVRKPLIEHTYIDCPIDNCPYLANGTIEEHLLEIDDIPEYPSGLFLAYEGNCNYNCTCCTSCENMRQGREKNWSDNYNEIYEKIKPILPYIKTISAHGRGELFASPHIMQVLSEWEPISPNEEISVDLETNGSLFNENNWKKIENLGKYNLSVNITVMSFDEDVYQYLSGTKMPISNLIDNLHFVKELRNQGVINYLELATVLQEQNFREMPEFTRRCIEEFGADCVRIRPIMPGGPLDKNIQWFMDVRNPYHPYYKEYKKVMENPIFKNPKVLLWSAGLDSEIGDIPWKQSEKELRINSYINRMVQDEHFICELASVLEKNDCDELSIYGMGRIGKLLIQLAINETEIEIRDIYDTYLSGSFKGLKIKKIDERKIKSEKKDMILLTVLGECSEITDKIKRTDDKVKIITIEKLLNEIEAL